jgi:hypothetical protein
MEDRFSLVLSLKTPAGFEVFGQFGIRDDSSAASALFDSLKGDEKLSSASVLHIDLMETDGLLPAKIRMKSCRLDELAANCKLITREIFRQKNLRVYEE